MTTTERKQSIKYRQQSADDNNHAIEARISVEEGPEEAFTDPNRPPVPTKRRNSTKSVKSLNKNKVFPSKLPPIRKTKKEKKMAKIKSVRIADPTYDGFEVRWKNLSYIVEKRPNPLLPTTRFPTYRVILKCLNGFFKSSQLTAVMGPSGAGKTTLLACVCGKRTIGVSGAVTISGCNRIKVAIISQDDFLTDKFTLREALLFASKTKNGTRLDHEEMLKNVVNSLSLESVLDTRLGKCSGGQRRRVSIALELVSNPNILVLDEPTSGLDSSVCYQLVENLRDLTQNKRNPMAIVCTIHQPSAKVFNLFHNIYVISHNGQNIYHGPPGTLVDYLRQMNMAVPEFHNPADYIAEIASADHGEESITKLATFRKESAKSEQASELSKESTFKIASVSYKYKHPALTHLFLLMHRAFKLTIREPHLSWLRITTSVITGIFVGLLFGYDLGPVAGCPPRHDLLFTSRPTDLLKDFENEHKAIQQNLGVIFYNTVYLMFGGIMPMIMVFPKEFNVITKQYTNGWYSSITYYLSKFFTDLPITILATTIYVTLWYLLSAQVMELWRYSVVLGLSLCTMSIGISQGMICSALFPRNPVTASYVGLVSATPFFLLSGFFVKSEQIPTYLRPLTSLSYTKYSFESTIIAIYGYDRCAYTPTNDTISPPDWLTVLASMTSSLKDDVRVSDHNLNSSSSTMTSETDSMNDILSMFSGTKVDINSSDTQSVVLSQFGFTDDMLIYNSIVLALFVLGFQLIAYIVFVSKLNKNNN